MKKVKKKLLNIALDNTQVEYILKDEDVYNFYKEICDEANCAEAEDVRKIMEKNSTGKQHK